MSRTIKEVLEIAERHGLLLEEKTCVCNESGLDFQVVFATDQAGDEWVLRFPRRKDVSPKTKIEKSVLDLIHQKVSFEVPHWSVYTEELIAYKRLQGVPAATIDMATYSYIWELDEKNVPMCFHQTLGAALASLHRMEKQKAMEAGLVIHSPEEARESMKERMEAVRRTYGVGESLWARWQSWLQDVEMWPKETGLIHGDVHAGHILIDKNANVTGLIDWTEAKVTDMSNDFVGYYRIFGEEGLDCLIRAYQEAGGYVWSRMKEHIIELTAAYPVAIAEFALQSELDEFEQMAKEALEIS